MHYIDTSVIVTLLTDEPETGIVQGWFAARASETYAVSAWTITEFSSALSIKLRLGNITTAERDTVLAAFDISLSSSLIVVPVLDHHFITAARLADRYRSGLRSGDALHLAIVSEQGMTLCTRDRKQAEAGAALGIPTEVLA